MKLQDQYAFPSPDFVYPSGHVRYGETGMTLRQWYAGVALGALLPAGGWNLEHPRSARDIKNITEQAVLIADQLLAELQEEGE